MNKASRGISEDAVQGPRSRHLEKGLDLGPDWTGGELAKVSRR